MTFISISIDICGSTEAKAKLRNHASLIAREPSQLYETFQKQVLWIESTFWTLLRSGSLEIERLFLIKTIGDELWYAYDLEGLQDFEVHASIVKMISVLIGLHTKDFEIVAGPVEDPYDWKNTAPATLRRISLPLKITMDLVSDALEMNKLREKYLTPHVAELLTPLGKPRQRAVQEGDEDFIKLCNHLGVSSRVATMDKCYSLTRSDYIGWEVDRFFRLTKEAIKNAVLIGPEILNAFDTHQLIETNGTEKFSSDGKWLMSAPLLKVQNGSCITSIGDYQFARRTVPAADLKGVGADCNIAVVYCKYQRDVKLSEGNSCSLIKRFFQFLRWWE